jgi:uncharacterized membrane protein
MGKSSGLSENVLSALAYVFSFFSGILFLVFEKESKKIRFHALQSVVLGFVVAIIQIALKILAGIPFIGLLFGFVAGIVGLAFLAVTIFLIYMAYKGTEFKLPIIGDAAWNQIYNK